VSDIKLKFFHEGALLTSKLHFVYHPKNTLSMLNAQYSNNIGFNNAYLFLIIFCSITLRIFVGSESFCRLKQIRLAHITPQIAFVDKNNRNYYDYA
jgi:hypothetical protein